MKKIKNLSFILLLSFSLILTSCSALDKKDNVSNSSDNTSKAYTTENDISNEIGKEYEVGMTPDDYSVNNSDKNFSLKEKQSKYYPKNGVKGIYVNAWNVADDVSQDNLIDMLKSRGLNTIVIDVKDDWGNVIFGFETDNSDINYSSVSIINPKKFIKKMHKNKIYVIGRITTFKDSVITDAHPEYSFTNQDGTVWKNDMGETFMNPFLKDVWDYDVSLALLSAKVGFDEIQFDYVRFAEGFENLSDQLIYSYGDYETLDLTDGEKRVKAITDFVSYARDKLSKVNVPIGIDVFGYAMQVGRAEGIGQDFSSLANEVDVMSSMIYPSHWGNGSFDIEIPDLEPYQLVMSYMKAEDEIFKSLDHRPKTRPWLQDFTASYLGEGNYMVYTKDAVQAEVNAIYDSGFNEFLLWNASGNYTEGVDYE
ncbi:MAG: putative glycoside hydrolase [Peptoniphilaceae bacterium]|nr:putative glycoside hydrolase [Peptoniphilaceae bacterium]MDD7383775.1 putative glycoside hydrolase [Peptoniphilaceae bacterium]MDY3738103.1 putative glycoside hydrolase [Peptoniphilaceae bacterium]